MRLVRYQQDHPIKIGFLFGEQILELSLAMEYWEYRRHKKKQSLEINWTSFTDIVQLLQAFDVVWSELQLAYDHLQNDTKQTNILGVGTALIGIDQVNLVPPLGKPGKMICVGLNYPPVDKINPIEIPQYPVLFHKVTTSLTGHQTPIILPEISETVDYEGELALVVGKPGKKIARQSAFSYLAGYTIANDVGARDIQARSSQWTSGKMFDTFCPLGPALVSSDEVPHPNQLRIQTILNDQTVQDSSTAKMIFDIPTLISYISSLTSLEPGDLILSGSPKNIGEKADPRQPLQPGDLIQVHIENLGCLTNTVEAEET